MEQAWEVAVLRKELYMLQSVMTVMAVMAKQQQMHQPAHQPAHQPIHQPMHKPVKQPVKQPVEQVETHRNSFLKPQPWRA